MLSGLRPAHRSRCAARQHASTIAIEMLSLCGWPHLHDCLQITLRSAMAVCPHSDYIIVFQLGLVAKCSIIIWAACYPRYVACSDLANCISAWPYGQACFLFFGPLTARVARTSACLIYSNRDALSGWPHLHDCFQITLRSAMAVCPHSDCMIAFQLGLFRPSVFSLTLGSLTARVARRQCASTIAIAMLSLRRAAAIACK